MKMLRNFLIAVVLMFAYAYAFYGAFVAGQNSTECAQPAVYYTELYPFESTEVEL